MKKAAKSFLTVFLCFAMLVTSNFLALNASAVTQAEIDALEAQRDELQERQDNVQEQLESLQNDRESMLDRKAALDEQSELLRQDIVLINEQIALYDTVIAEKKEEAERAAEAEEEHYARYCQRVRTMEENSSWSYISFLLKAESLSELLSRLTDIFDVMSYDENIQAEYAAACEYAAETLAEYEAVQEAQKVKQGELLEREVELEEKIEASADVIAALEGDIEKYMEYYESVEAEKEDVRKLIDEKAEELRKQQEAEAAKNAPAASQPGSGIISGGYYVWPSTTTYITSPFGPRVHPIYGQLKPHTGVDIGAWYGTEIYAAASGTVSLAVVDYGSTGYGTYVAIYHPNGTTTLYAHMSALAVSVGQTVSQGQVIGYVGSTGASNGPHLHFEIRQNGVCMDPMLYF